MVGAAAIIAGQSTGETFDLIKVFLIDPSL